MNKKNLNAAFRELRKAGYFAKQNFMCCQTCGCSKVPDEKEDRYVFYHSQDNDDLKRSGICYLSWAGNGREICDILNRNGVQTDWDGSPYSRIKIII